LSFLSLQPRWKSKWVDTDAGCSKQTLKFVVDKNTQVQGQVKIGTMVAVEYQPTDGGQLLCARVSAQNG
jgi:hypothetical protein